MSRNLAEWLAYQEHVNPRSIELGLERVRSVWQRMGAAAPARRVVTVGGTNGKGSTVALLEAMAQGAGLHVGAFTSPHLLAYNERVRIDGRDAGDAALVEAFEAVEDARTAGDEVPLTYFEYGTLAALWLFERSGLDLAILEVGLGGLLLEAIRDVFAVPLPTREGEVASILGDSAIGRFLASRSDAMFGSIHS